MAAAAGKGPSTPEGEGGEEGGGEGVGEGASKVSEADLAAFMAEMEARERGAGANDAAPGAGGAGAGPPRGGASKAAPRIRQVDDDPVDTFLDVAKERAEATSQAVAESGRKVLQSLNKVLVADFFFIVFALVWLITGVLADKAFGWSGPAELWFSLWTPVFQPAIGILMLGSIVTGTVDNILDKD